MSDLKQQDAKPTEIEDAHELQAHNKQSSNSRKSLFTAKHKAHLKRNSEMMMMMMMPSSNKIHGDFHLQQHICNPT
jgi:hypothetical protein